MPKQEIKAAVVRQEGGPFTIETLHLPDPREDEVLVRIEAAGICQTDAHACDQAYPVPLPAVWSGLVAALRRFLRAVQFRHIVAGDRTESFMIYGQHITR